LETIKQQIDEEFEMEKSHQVSNRQLMEFYKDARDATFLIRQKTEDGTDRFSFYYDIIMEYLIARRIVTNINQNVNEKKTEIILQYLQEIKTHETFEFIDYITDIEWSIKSHIAKDLYSSLKTKKLEIMSKMDREDVIHKLISYASKRSQNSNSQDKINIGNLVSVLYSLSEFAKFSFKKTAKEYTTKISFEKCNLKDVRLPYANLMGTNFANSNLFHANLSNANLANANMSGAILYYADFSGADLSGADLSRSKMIETNLSGADLSGADLSYINT
jgi:hypothetical protein